MRYPMLLLTSAFVAGMFGGSPAPAQAPGLVIERGTDLVTDGDIIRSALVLKDAGKLLSYKQVKALRASPPPAKVELPPRAEKELPAREVYRRARAAFVRIGWLCKCPECEEWELDLAAGYAIAKDGVVATAEHLLAPDAAVREPYFLAVTADGQALPITSILEVDADLDAAIVRVEGFRGEPLALNDNVHPGDAAFCFSDPLNVRGYFTAGIVNRFYWCEDEEEGAGDATKLDRIAKLRLNVNLDWGPGSSGAAVLDVAGNAIGHVSTIAPIGEGLPADEAEDIEPADPIAKSDSPDADAAEQNSGTGSAPMFQLHDAVPARGVRLLVEEINRPLPPLKAANPAALLAKLQKLVDKDMNRADSVWTMRRISRRFDGGVAEFHRKYPEAPERWGLPALEVDVAVAMLDLGLEKIPDMEAHLRPVIEATEAPLKIRRQASRQLLEVMSFLLLGEDAEPNGAHYLGPWEALLAKHEAAFPEDDLTEILTEQLDLLASESPELAALIAEKYEKRGEQRVAEAARGILAQLQARKELATKPMALKFTALDGREVDLAKLRGQVVLVDFWASWCGPCLVEVPRVASLYKQFKDQGFTVVGISLDDNRKALEQAVKAKGITWPQKFSGQGWDDPLVKQYGISGIPAMWLVNKAGRVVDQDVQGDLAEKVGKLLTEP